MITIKEAIKRYKRFLKEVGKYSSVKKIHISSAFKFNTDIENLFLKSPKAPFLWMNDVNTFCAWSNTKEGVNYWWKVSLMWQMICIIENITLKHPKWMRYDWTSEKRFYIKKVICEGEYILETHESVFKSIEELTNFKKQVNYIRKNFLPDYKQKIYES